MRARHTSPPCAPPPLYGIHRARRKERQQIRPAVSIRPAGITALTRRVCRREMNRMPVCQDGGEIDNAGPRGRRKCRLASMYGNLPTMQSGGSCHGSKRPGDRYCLGSAELLVAPDVRPGAIANALVSGNNGMLQITRRSRTARAGIMSTTPRHGITGGRAGAEFLDYGVLQPAGPDAATQRHPEQ